MCRLLRSMLHLLKPSLVQLGILCNHLHARHEHAVVSCAFAAEHNQSICCGQDKMALRIYGMPEDVRGIQGGAEC